MHLGQAAQFGLGHIGKARWLHAAALQNAAGHAALLVEHGKQQMQRAEFAVTGEVGLALRALDGFLCKRGEFVESHGVWFLLSAVHGNPYANQLPI